MNPTIVFVDDNEVGIGATNFMLNLAMKFVDVKFDQEQLAKDEWLQMMQHKHHIDMMLFSERSPLDTENQVEDTLSVATCICKELEAREVEKEA